MNFQRQRTLSRGWKHHLEWSSICAAQAFDNGVRFQGPARSPSEAADNPADAARQRPGHRVAPRPPRTSSSRVSTLPRIGTTSIRRPCALGPVLQLHRPARGPGADPGTVAQIGEPAARPARRGCPRAPGRRRTSRLRSGAVGRSFSECTATSIAPARRASRTAPAKTPVPPISVSAPRSTSPVVVMPTNSDGDPAGRAAGRRPGRPGPGRAGRYARRAGRPEARPATTRGSSTTRPDLRRHHRGDGLRVEGEQLAQRGGVVHASGSAGQLLDPYGRRVQQLVDDPAYGPLHLGALRVVQVGQPRSQPAHLAGHHLRSHGAQRDHGRGDLGGPPQAQEVAHLELDQVDAASSISPDAGRIELLGDQPVEVDQGDRRARRPSGPRRRGSARSTTPMTGVPARSSRPRCSVRAPVQVTSTSVSAERGGQIGQRDRRAADRVGQPLGPAEGAVDTGDARAGGGRGPGRQTGHGAGADDQHPTTGESVRAPR